MIEVVRDRNQLFEKVSALNLTPSVFDESICLIRRDGGELDEGYGVVEVAVGVGELDTRGKSRKSIVS